MSLEGPDATNNLTVAVTIENGVRIFTAIGPEPANLRWNANHRRLDIAKPGRYFLTLVAKGFTLANPAIEFKGPHKGISVYQEESNESTKQATILIATDAAEGERAEFNLIGLNAAGKPEIIDPTILVEPPGGVSSEEAAVPSLTVNVSLADKGHYIYTPDQAETPNLVWLDAEQTAKITAAGTFRVIFKAAFKLGPLGILFPNGKPTNVTRSKDEDEVTVEIAARAGLPQEIPLQIEKADNGFVPNEPTILVEPPGGDE